MHKQAEYTKARQYFNKALSLQDDMYEAHQGLANVFQETGDLADALQSYRQALFLSPDDSGTYSSLLFTMNYLPEVSQKEIYRESLKWGGSLWERFI